MFKKNTFLFFLVVILFSCSKKEIKQPNIVLIMADDMGYECIGANGSTQYRTPNIDQLGKEGVQFKHCYSQPLCTPSRVKIMTGKYNFRNYEDFGYLNPNQQTFANLLHRAGYKTCIAGKWQLNGLNRGNPNNQDIDRPHHFGFDEYCLWQLNHRRKDGERYADPLITQNGKDLPRNENSYGPQIFADYVCNFIDRKAGNPFFVYYPMVLVHDPFVPTPDSPEWNEPWRQEINDTTYFPDMVAFADKIVGQIESKLKEKGVWENTLFIFIADNGTNKSIVSKTNYGVVNGGKGLSINTGNHVPMFVSWPEKIKKDTVINALISLADFLPALCDAAGIDSTEYKTDGKSFLPLLTGETTKTQNEVFIHYSPRWGRFKSNRWVMNGKYKLYRDGRFYNTANDTLEQTLLTNLTKQELKIKQRFQKIIDEKENEIAFSLNDTTFNVTY